MPITSFSEEKYQRIFAGAATLLALDVAAYIVLYFLSHPSSTGSFLPSSGAEIFIPFLLAGLVAGVLALIFTPRGNIILALALQILITMGGFFGAAYWQTATRNKEITQMARQEYEACQKAYEQHKGLFKVSNFTAEPVKDIKTEKVTAIKVGVDIAGIDSLPYLDIRLGDVRNRVYKDARNVNAEQDHHFYLTFTAEELRKVFSDTPFEATGVPTTIIIGDLKNYLTIADSSLIPVNTCDRIVKSTLYIPKIPVSELENE